MRKKTTKKNYYNLIVYFIKFFSVFELILGFSFCLPEWNIIPYKYYDLLLAMFFIDGLLLLICLYLLEKFGSKITIEFDSPKKPHTYNIKNTDITELFNLFASKLENKEYNFIKINDENNIVYFKNVKKNFLPYQVNVFIFYEFNEFNQESLDYLEITENNIFGQFKYKDNFPQVAVIIKVQSINKYLSLYLLKRTHQHFYGSLLMTFMVEETNKIYIPHAEIYGGKHTNMRKEIEKVLEEHIEKIENKKK